MLNPTPYLCFAALLIGAPLGLLLYALPALRETLTPVLGARLVFPEAECKSTTSSQLSPSQDGQDLMLLSDVYLSNTQDSKFSVVTIIPRKRKKKTPPAERTKKRSATSKATT